jgi:hypothetical protein
LPTESLYFTGDEAQPEPSVDFQAKLCHGKAAGSVELSRRLLEVQ